MATVLTQPDLQTALAQTQRKAAQILGKTEAEQRRLGYYSTLKEICQQPWTWSRTCQQILSLRDQLVGLLDGTQAIVFTGSGSSEYAGDCLRLSLKRDLAIDVQSVSAGALLLQRTDALPNSVPGLLVSLARSGNSPESAAAVRVLLESGLPYRHLVITCNEKGGLAQSEKVGNDFFIATLAPETNDESLVMTSSFTNLILAARFLGFLHRPAEFERLCSSLGAICQQLILNYFDRLAVVASSNFRRVAFLGTASRFSACREASLKMLEMSAGLVATTCETFLGLRHGPMSFINPDTLIVCQFSSDPVIRAYELDLLSELNSKRLGLAKVIIGENIPSSALLPTDLAVNCPGLSAIHDDDAIFPFIVAAQLLAFFKCLAEGLSPDSPSETGIINRVVSSFPLHTFL